MNINNDLINGLMVIFRSGHQKVSVGLILRREENQRTRSPPPPKQRRKPRTECLLPYLKSALSGTKTSALGITAPSLFTCYPIHSRAEYK